MKERFFKITDNIWVVKKAGFCFGVERSLKIANEALDRALREGINAYSIGKLIHNSYVVNSLERRGLKVRGIEDVEDGSIVVFRSHGVPRQYYDIAKRKGLIVFDATCPLVQNAQRIVKKLTEEGKNVIIIGDVHHPEVKAMVSYAVGNSKVKVMEPTHVLKGEYERGAEYVFQTTANRDVLEFLKRAGENVHDTICNATKERQRDSVELAKVVNVMVVVGGKDSSNTTKVYQKCKVINNNTYFVQDWEEFQKLGLPHRKDLIYGFTAGASTPREQIIDIARKWAEVLGMKVVA